MNVKGTRIIQLRREPTFEEKLDKLFTEDPIALFRLIWYCHKPYEIKNRLDDSTIAKLVERNLLQEGPVVPAELRELILATTSVT